MIGFALGKIELAKFVNPDGMLKLGENLYQKTDASGDEQTGTPGQDGYGNLRQGFLEQSNVEPVNELIDFMYAMIASISLSFSANGGIVEGYPSTIFANGTTLTWLIEPKFSEVLMCSPSLDQGLTGCMAGRVSVIALVVTPTLGNATPIKQSRVTISASWSSSQPSVPSGRTGITMKRCF